MATIIKGTFRDPSWSVVDLRLRHALDTGLFDTIFRNEAGEELKAVARDVPTARVLSLGIFGEDSTN